MNKYAERYTALNIKKINHVNNAITQMHMMVYINVYLSVVISQKKVFFILGKVVLETFFDVLKTTNNK